MNIYFISGLGADRRAFQFLDLDGLGADIRYLDWIAPWKKESLPGYARRMAAAIDTKNPFVLVGLSFGGLIAVEINRFLQPAKTILISSLGNRHDLPRQFRFLGWSGLYKLAPDTLLKTCNPYTLRFFGAKTPEEQQVLQQMMMDSDLDFSRWAVKELLCWQFQEDTDHLVKIHGTKDRLLPLGRRTVDHTISGGGHFMIVNKADQISDILKRELCLS